MSLSIGVQKREANTNLNSLPQKKIPSVGSFTTNMNNHIALQTKGSPVDLTIKESYMHQVLWETFQVRIKKGKKEM